MHLDATEHGDKLIFLHTVKGRPGESELRTAGRGAGGRAAEGHQRGAQAICTSSSDDRLQRMQPRPQQELLLELRAGTANRIAAVDSAAEESIRIR